MKKRVLTNWSIRRVLYLALGIIVIIQAVHDREWLWLMPGGYFASMGLLGFGCAAGNCFTDNCPIEPISKKR